MQSIDKTYRILIIAFGMVMVLLGTGYGLFTYLSWKASDQTRIEEGDFIRIEASELTRSFQLDESVAANLYIEKVLKVKGEISEISFLNNRHTVLLQGNDSTSFVLCDLQESEASNMDQLNIGQWIEIKGVCKGFLVDAIMLNCKIIQEDHE